MRRIRTDIKTDTWKKYDNGLNYLRKIKYFATVAECERMVAGEQWHGLERLKLTKAVFNMLKRIVDFKVSSVMSQSIKMNFTVDGYSQDEETENAESYDRANMLFSKYSNTTWEYIKEDLLNEEMLLNSATAGLGVKHYYWDNSIKRGNDILAVGEVQGEVIDSINYFPGNPNDRRVQTQPYIIISYRESVSKAKETAEKYGVPKEKIKLITADSNTREQAFDKAQQEIDNNSMTTVLLYYTKKKGKVYWSKSTKNVEIVPLTPLSVDEEGEPNFTLYPVATMNWGVRKRSTYGVGEVAPIIQNQIGANILLSMAIESAKRSGIPKAIFNRTMLPNGFSNAIGKAIGVQGEDINNAVKYLDTGKISFDVYKVLDLIIQMTKDFSGANENALGESAPDNARAIAYQQKQSAIPIETIKRRFYQCEEDVGRVWAEFWKTKYNTERAVQIENNEGKKVTERFNGVEYRNLNMNIKVDIGPSSQWSEILSMETLDKLLDKEKITFLEYLDRFPEGYIPKQRQLKDAREEQDENKQIIWELSAKLLETLPPEQQEQIKALPTEQQEQTLKQMLMQQNDIQQNNTQEASPAM